MCLESIITFVRNSFTVFNRIYCIRFHGISPRFIVYRVNIITHIFKLNLKFITLLLPFLYCTLCWYNPFKNGQQTVNYWEYLYRATVASRPYFYSWVCMCVCICVLHLSTIKTKFSITGGMAIAVAVGEKTVNHFTIRLALEN